jgi:hypothetical protein
MAKESYPDVDCARRDNRLLLQPTSVADTLKLLRQHGEDAWIMAGGLDSFD